MTNNENHSNLLQRPTYKVLEKELRILKKRIHTPKVDLIEFETTYQVNMELPGILKEDLKIELKENHMLLVSGIKKNNTEPNGKIIYKECNHDEFTRRVKLPGFVKIDIVSGTFENGILSLIFSKLDLDDNSAIKQITF